MRAKLVFMVVGSLLLPCLVMADGLRGTPGVSVMYGDRGDGGEGFGASLRYRFPLGCGELMLSGSASDGEARDSGISNGNTFSRGPLVIRDDITIWAATADFIRTVEPDDRGSELFCGGGVGWYKVDGVGFEEDSFGGQVLGGINFKSNWFAELRYVFATDFSSGGQVVPLGASGRGSDVYLHPEVPIRSLTSDVDGVRFSIGYWFR